ncbi:MAG: hypothetical protein GXO79_07160 [Chlorobi bacterium]|nr:hypothetical protein [Chlorobiota bacterium]
MSSVKKKPVILNKIKFTGKNKKATAIKNSTSPRPKKLLIIETNLFFFSEK